jgi:hypothetical protein
MTALKMHWQLIPGADGRSHLNIQWELAWPDFVHGFAHANSPKRKTKIGKFTDLVRCSA